MWSSEEQDGTNSSSPVLRQVIVKNDSVMHKFGARAGWTPFFSFTNYTYTRQEQYQSCDMITLHEIIGNFAFPCLPKGLFRFRIRKYFVRLQIKSPMEMLQDF